MLDRFRSMEVFVAAVDAGSFAAASERLGMTPQMVARYVQSVEERLQVTLIQRTTRRQTLTDVGLQYYERCVQVLKDADAADAIAQQALNEPHGLLRISAPQQFGSQSLVDFCLAFMRRYPRVEVDLSLSDQVVNLFEEGVEIAFRIGELHLGDSSSFIARALNPYRVVACASPAYLASAGNPKTPADLAAHQCIPWENLPQSMGYGSGMTCWRRLREWQAAGVWQQLHLAMLEHLREYDQIDWGRASIDGSSVPSPRGARKQAPTPQIEANSAPSDTSS